MTDKRIDQRYELPTTASGDAIVYRMQHIPSFFHSLEQAAKSLDPEVDGDAPVATVTHISQAPSYSADIEKAVDDLKTERQRTELDIIRADIDAINQKAA